MPVTYQKHDLGLLL